MVRWLLVIIVTTAFPAAAAPTHSRRSHEREVVDSDLRCDLDRQRFPVNWNDTSRDTPLFNCIAIHYGTHYRIKLSGRDTEGDALMSMVPIDYADSDHGRRLEEILATDHPSYRDEQHALYRVWLEPAQQAHLLGGVYFASAVRTEHSCEIRNNTTASSVFIMNNETRPASQANQSSSLSTLNGDTYECWAVADPSPIVLPFIDNIDSIVSMSAWKTSSELRSAFSGDSALHGTSSKTQVQNHAAAVKAKQADTKPY